MLDRGFRWGDAVYDATRTFVGRLLQAWSELVGVDIVDQALKRA